MLNTIEKKGLREQIISIIDRLFDDPDVEKGSNDPNLFTLHIGLNYVNPQSYNGWSGDLRGAVNDATMMNDYFGQRTHNNRLILNSAATADKIREAISTMVEEVQKTSDPKTVVITYSGHGGQVVDSNGDESDNKDETWCLFDRHMTDDEILFRISGFKRDTTIIIISDSCHSGILPKSVMGSVLASELMSAKNELMVAKNGPNLVVDRSNRFNRANIDMNIIVMSACAENQYAYDLASNGLFTKTLSDVLKEEKPKTIRQLMRAVSKRMPVEQSPQLYLVGSASGAFVDKTIL